MENYLIFDLLILGFILISAFFAFLRGFSHELLAVLNWIIALTITYNFGDKFVNLINKFINNLFFSSALSYVITFLIIFVVFSFLTRNFSGLIKKSDIGFIDRTGGFFLV